EHIRAQLESTVRASRRARADVAPHRLILGRNSARVTQAPEHPERAHLVVPLHSCQDVRRLARPEIVANVVGPRAPQADVRTAGLGVTRLRHGASIERRTPTLVDVVVDPSALAIKELELTVQSLAVPILERRQPGERFIHRLIRCRDPEPWTVRAAL